MSKSGRNALCPCGSGKKYKRCCELGFSDDDEQSVLAELADLVDGLMLREGERIMGLFYGLRGYPAGSSKEEDAVFHDWVLFDARAIDGSSLIDHLLRSARLARGARAYASTMRKTAMRLYEVTDPGRGTYVALHDVLDNSSISVPRRDLWHIRGDHYFLAARVVPRGPSGGAEIRGTYLEFPAYLKSMLIEHLRYGLATFRAMNPHALARAEYEALAPILHACYGLALAVWSRPPPESGAEARELDELHLQRRYDGWLDTPIEELGGVSPRAAAGSPELVPRLVGILRGLEREYERCLALDEPAFDPCLLWDDLGLREARDGPRNHPPPLGHETMADLVPDLVELAGGLAARNRAGPDHDLERTIPQSAVTSDPAVERFLMEHVKQSERADPDHLVSEATDLAIHIWLRANFELHLRKVFWVADALSWMLGTTSLDGIEGESLRLPFASIALVYTDRYALSIFERLLARTTGHPLKGKILRVLTVYVNELSLPGDRRGFRIVFTGDAQGDRWPALVGRDLIIDPGSRVVDVLASEVPGVDADELAPIFSCIPMRHLLHLVINTLLFATSSRLEASATPPPPRQLPSAPRRERRSSEAVYELPGTIDISVLRAIQRARRGAVSREQIHRYLVRGYRRRANPGWKDQDYRWIKPHWRGPKDGAIIERQYRIKP